MLDHSLIDWGESEIASLFRSPFLIPSLGLPAHRFWQYLLWIVLTAGTALALSRRATFPAERAFRWLLAGTLVSVVTLTTLLWSSNFVIGRAIRDDVSPSALNFLRWALALLVLVPLTWRDLRAHRTALRRHWKLLALLGPSLRNVIIVIAVALIPNYARVSRALVFSTKANQWVEAERALGAGINFLRRAQRRGVERFLPQTAGHGEDFEIGHSCHSLWKRSAAP